jgi:hypothetical protein
MVADCVRKVLAFPSFFWSFFSFFRCGVGCGGVDRKRIRGAGVFTPMQCCAVVMGFPGVGRGW